MFFTRPIALIFAAALLLCACGDDDSSKPDTTTAKDFAVSETAKADSGPTDGHNAEASADKGAADAAPQSPQVITPKRAFELIKAGGHTIIDLREPSELPPTGIIEGALKLPYNSGTFNSAYSTAVPNKNASVMLYCASGVRSSQAAKALDRAGYTLIYDIAGGMSAWKAAGLPTVAP